MRISRIGLLLAAASTLWAWNAAGHKTIAFIAYQKLSGRARANVDRLLQSHPDYHRWIEGVPEADRPLEAFLHASIWADEIKGDPNYKDEPRDAQPPQHPTYPDQFRHRNWHYIDTPLIGEFDALHVDVSSTAWRNPPTAVSQIGVMESLLRDHKSSDAAKAWALGWLIHLVGDLHQPLHCVSRYSKDPATGKLVDDQGGNRVRLAGKQHNLHAFWDDALSEDASTVKVRALGDDLIAASSVSDTRGWSITKPNQWVDEGTRLSIEFVYRGLAGAPSENGVVALPATYERVAEGVAEQRAVLGGYRLANLLNKLLGR